MDGIIRHTGGHASGVILTPFERVLMAMLLNFAAQLMEVDNMPIEDRARELTALRNALELMK
jgi:hypothetical protein